MRNNGTQPKAGKRRLSPKQQAFITGQRVALKHSGLLATVLSSDSIHTHIRFKDGTTSSYVHSHLRACRKQTPKQQAFLFFYKYAGFSFDPAKETKRQGRARSARELARAERDARELGFTFDWVEDSQADRSWMQLAEEQEAFGCICYGSDGEQQASLWGIFDPSREYRRVVEAELAQEALGEMEVGR